MNAVRDVILVHGLWVPAVVMTPLAALPTLGARDAWQLAGNSFEASFADAADKARWRDALNASFAAAGA